MSRTVQEIYDIAIHLMDAQRESDGNTKYSETATYRVRTCPLLSTLLNEVYPYSDTYAQALAQAEPGRRPTLPPVTAFTDLVALDDYLCMSVLPVGLAALFLRDEDQALYGTFWADYQTRVATAAARLPTGGFEDIENPYYSGQDFGGIEHGQYGRWSW